MAAASRIRTAVYPGSFDPLTYGHIDILARGLKLFDRILVAILHNSSKQALFPTSERVEMIEAAVAESAGREAQRVKVEVFDGLLVDYARRRGAEAILRGVRAVSDFEYEFQMALMNRRLDSRIQTVFMMPSEETSYVSSRLVKEVAALGGRLSGVVPPLVEEKLRQKLRSRKRRGKRP